MERVRASAQLCAGFRHPDATQFGGGGVGRWGVGEEENLKKKM